MTLSYVDFIAPNVDVCVKYCVDGKHSWIDGRVVRVLDRYEDEDDNDTECVKCIVSFDDDTCTETFKEVHYNSDDDDAWCFGDKFVQLVEQVKYIANDETSCDSEDVQCVDDCSCCTDESLVTETDSDEGVDDDGEEEEQEEEDEKRRTIKKKHSLVNNVGAVLFMLSPWIASTWVLFNARHEILDYMARHEMINYMRNV